jgi:hypothetical protein
MFEGGVIEVNCELVRLDSQDYWKQLHAKLKGIDVRRSKLDAEEMELLFEAEDAELYRRLGHPTMTAYMVAELECSVHSANEKLRVSRELFELPLVAAELREGTLNWTKVRELTRVVTEDTENEWLDAVEGKTSTEVQQMVRGLKKGARPGDRPDLSIVKEWIGLEVTPQIAAMWRRVRIALDNEAGRHLGDDELAEQICKRVLTPEAPVDAPSKPAFQIAVTTCRVCKHAQQVGPGVENEIDPRSVRHAAGPARDCGPNEPARSANHSPLGSPLGPWSLAIRDTECPCGVCVRSARASTRLTSSRRRQLLLGIRLSSTAAAARERAQRRAEQAQLGAGVPPRPAERLGRLALQAVRDLCDRMIDQRRGERGLPRAARRGPQEEQQRGRGRRGVRDADRATGVRFLVVLPELLEVVGRVHGFGAHETSSSRRSMVANARSFPAGRRAVGIGVCITNWRIAAASGRGSVMPRPSSARYAALSSCSPWWRSGTLSTGLPRCKASDISV